MALNVDQLATGLEHYRTSLAEQTHRQREQFEEVHALFNALFAIYAGRRAEELQQHWVGTAKWFENYVAECGRLDAFLEERTRIVKETL